MSFRPQADWRLPLSLLSLSLFLGSTTTAVAEEIIDQQLETASPSDQPSNGRWNITLGLDAGYSPRFEGAEHYHFMPIPYGSISYAGLGSLGPQGMTANIVKAGGLRAGLLVGYSGGRDQNDDPHLRGLGNISGSLQMGGFAAYEWNSFELKAQARQAVTHAGNGLTGSLGLAYTLRPASGWLVKLGPQLAFADDDHMKKFFGVTAGQSGTSGLQAYTPNGGLQDVAIGLNATYQLTNHWLLFGIARVSEIIGDAADSPIVQSKDQAFGGIGIAYHF